MNPLQIFYNTREYYGLNLRFSGIEACTRGHSFGPARRDHYLFHYILEGKGSYHVKGFDYQLHSGQGFLINPGDITLYSANSNEPWTYAWIAFDGPDADKLLRQCAFSDTHHIYTAKDHEKLMEMFKEIIQYAQHSDESYLNQLSRLYRLFSILISSIDTPLPNTSTPVHDAIEFITANYAYDIKVSDIAKAVMLERSYLYRIFTKEIGLSPKEYLTHYRLVLARDLLKEEELTITEIAFTCGFKSSSAFYKHFKKRYDITPNSYRTALSRKQN
jgi:AraC-like DNA-binding protein